MTTLQRLTELSRWMAVYCPIPGWRIRFYKWCGVDIGKNANINFGVNIIIPFSEKGVKRGNIRIGERVAIATAVVIIGQSHPDFSVLAGEFPIDDRPIHVRDDVWLGAGCIVFPGVTIGKQSVVSAGAVVTQDVPPRCVVAGNPARIIKYLD